MISQISTVLIFIIFNFNLVFCQYNWNVYKNSDGNYVGKIELYSNEIIYNAEMYFPSNVNFKNLWFCDENKPYCLVLCEAISNKETICDVNNKIIANFYYKVNSGINSKCNYPLELETIYHGSGQIENNVCGASCEGSDCNTWKPPNNFFQMG